MSLTHFAIVGRPGYCGNHTEVKSTHSRIDLARKAAKKHDWTDPSGQIKHPVCIIETDKRKGETIYWAGAGQPPRILE